MMYFKINAVKKSFYLDLEFRLPKKSITVIFGQSGAGKSTLLNAIIRNGVDSRAEIMVDDLRAHNKKIILVRQHPYLFPHLTIEKNMLYGFQRTKPKAQKCFFNNIIQKFNIEPLFTNYPADLSGGELQRAAIAQALLSRPTLLLLDESFSALDEKQKLIIMDNLKTHVIHENISVIFITHALSEVAYLADYVVSMHNGKIESIRPCNAFLEDNSYHKEKVYAAEKI